VTISSSWRVAEVYAQCQATQTAEIEQLLEARRTETAATAVRVMAVLPPPSQCRVAHRIQSDSCLLYIVLPQSWPVG
jgi:hypothetical protein